MREESIVSDEEIHTGPEPQLRGLNEIKNKIVLCALSSNFAKLADLRSYGVGCLRQQLIGHARRSRKDQLDSCRDQPLLTWIIF